MDPTRSNEQAVANGWTALRVFWALGVFVLAGLFEIGGGWLIWRGLREGREPRWVLAGGGSLCLVVYGFVPLLQPDTPATEFGRVFAVYGAIFIFMRFVTSTPHAQRRTRRSVLRQRGLLRSKERGESEEKQLLTNQRISPFHAACFVVPDSSYVWGAVLDGLRLDVGDYLGGALACAGAAIMFFYPR